MIGCGHLGATHAACMAELGHEVLGVDIEPDKVALLRTGRAWFLEPDLDDLLARHIKTGRLGFTTSFEEAARFGTVHFLGVGTPGLPDHSGYDLSQVFGAVAALAPHLTGPALIVGKSTVPPGTTARLVRELRRRAPAGDAVEVAWNPEFLREGRAVDDTLRPDRIVVGVPSMAAEATIREVYRPLTEAGIPLLTTDPVTAELVKGAANAFLATKVSFINAMADVCAKTGGDVATLADAVGMDARIGRAFLTAGIGYGGGCLPKDVRGLAAFAAAAGAETAAGLLGVVDEINSGRRQRVADLAAALLGDLSGKRIALWGRRSSPAPTTSATPPPWTWPTGWPASARRSWSTTRRRRATRWSPSRTWTRPTARWRRPGTRTRCSSARPGRSSPRPTPPPSPTVVANPLIIDACQGIPADQWRPGAGRWPPRSRLPTVGSTPPPTPPGSRPDQSGRSPVARRRARG